MLSSIPLSGHHEHDLQGTHQAGSQHPKLYYIVLDDFEGVAVDEHTAMLQFHCLQALLVRLGVQEARHNAQNPSQVLDWLGLRFDSWNMTVSLTPEKHTEVQDLVSTWSARCVATLLELRSLLGKLLDVAHVCPLLTCS